MLKFGFGIDGLDLNLVVGFWLQFRSGLDQSSSPWGCYLTLKPLEIFMKGKHHSRTPEPTAGPEVRSLAHNRVSVR